MIEISRVKFRVVALDKWLSPVATRALSIGIAIMCWVTPVFASDNEVALITGPTAQIGELEPAVIKNTVSFKDVQCLAQNIYHEAGGEPEVGKVAVGVVTINRSLDNRFPKSICGVVKQAVSTNSGPRLCQFSWVCAGKSSPNESNPAWRESLRIAKMLLEGGYETHRLQFKGAKFFHATSEKGYWARGLARVGQIGGHIFYR